MSKAKLRFRPRDVVAAFGSQKLYERARACGWLSSVVQQRKLLLFDSADVERVWRRIKNGELPPIQPANDKQTAR